MNVRASVQEPDVIYIEGWHNLEVPEGGGIEWRWSKREGHIWLRNPKRDAVFVIELDQPLTVLPRPQRVEIRVGAAVVDRFDLPPGGRDVRRVAISAAQLGTDNISRMVVRVDEAFVPAAVPGAQGGDTRELGVRVFDAYVEPEGRP